MTEATINGQPINKVRGLPHPIFILDGPDGTGKSTLAQVLVNSSRSLHGGNGKIFHQNYRFKDQMPNYHLAVLRKARKAAERGPVVIDRLWPSELAYGRVFRGGSPFDGYQYGLIWSALAMGAMTIFCHIQNKTDYLRIYDAVCKSRKEEPADVFEISQLWDQYDSMAKSACLLRPNGWSFQMYDRLIDDELIPRATRMYYSAQKFRDVSNVKGLCYTGNWCDPKRVVVFSQKDSDQHPHKLRPFEKFSQDALNMGRMLAAGDPRAVFDTAFANVAHPHFPMLAARHRQWRQVLSQKVPVLAVGETVAQFLKLRKIPVTKVVPSVFGENQ